MGYSTCFKEFFKIKFKLKKKQRTKKDLAYGQVRTALPSRAAWPSPVATLPGALLAVKTCFEDLVGKKTKQDNKGTWTLSLKASLH